MATKDIRSPGIKTLTTGGVTGIHFDPGGPSLVIAPADKGEFNVIKFAFAPIACLRIEDLRFNFDSSIPLPELAAEMKSLAELRQLNPRAPISIFGHADPVGSDDYNKILSGRRAKANIRPTH